MRIIPGEWLKMPLIQKHRMLIEAVTNNKR